MIYSLCKNNKEGTFLHPTSNYYSEEYAKAMCDLYLKDEIVKDEHGKIKKYYRLHAKHAHTQEEAFVYDIECPNCSNGRLKQVGRQLSHNELGLYACPNCNKRR